MDNVTERETHPLPQPYKGKITKEIKRKKKEANKNAEIRKKRLLDKYNKK
ncbi:hypothetical protein SAMN04487760_11221 [Lachnospiraceae bacterium G41]|nr:hypothetical protein SAMN04487760_11221 [Lachnospiraceae bacterium G41]